MTDRIKICVPYEERYYGTAYFTCEKEEGQTDEEFIKGVQDGDIIPYDVSIEDNWEHDDSEMISVHNEEAYKDTSGIQD